MADDPYAAIATPIDPYADIAKPIPVPATPGWRDRLTSRINSASMTPDTGWRGQIERFGQGAAQGLNATVLHPVQSAIAGGQALMAGGASGSAMGVPAMAMTGNPTVDAQNEQARSGARADAAVQGRQMAANPANTVGQLAGGFMASELPSAVLGAAAGVPKMVNESAQGIINKNVIGARGGKNGDFARGANPGRGYVENNLGTSGSMESIAEKAADARDQVGGQIGNALSQGTASGTLIPADDVRAAVHPVLDEAKRGASAPLVVGEPSVYDQMKASLEPALQAADAKGGFTPKELWDIQHDLNKSLNWGDQSRRNLTQTQQQISGALGGLVKDNVPEIAGLNQKYQDLVKLSNRAADRAQTGSNSLGGAISKGIASGIGGAVGHATGLGTAGGIGGAAAGAMLDSVPVKTAVATGISRAGQVLAPATRLPQIPPTAAIPAALTAVARNSQPQEPGNAQEQQGSQGTAEQPANVPENLAQGTPSASSITPQPTPDTHTFSTKEWLSGNPGGDPDEAKQAAQTLGYTIND